MDIKLILGVMTLLVLPFTTESGTCDLLTFHGGNYRNSGRVHRGFKGAIEAMNDYAHLCKVKIHLTSSFRKDDKKAVKGAIVKPSKISNHFVGHAIDMNLITPRSIGREHFCNSRCMVDKNQQTKEEKCFLLKVRKNTALRFGGDFSTPDPVHIDDGINRGNRAKYNRIFQSLQTNC